MLTSAVVLALWAGLSPGLTVETATPDALCPDLPALRRAIEARLGVVAVQGDRGWTARTTVGHAPGQEARDFVRLELFDPAGDRKMERDLPLAGESCATMAQIVALILERYFRGVGWSDGDLLPDASAASAVAAARAEPAAPPPRAPGHLLALRVGGGVSGGVSSSELDAAGVVGVRVDLGRHASLGISALLPPLVRSSAPQDPVRISSRAVPVRIGVDGGIGDRLSAALGPEILLSIEHAAREDGAASGTRLVVGVGASATLALALWQRLALELRGGIDYVLPLEMSQFVIAGKDGQVLKPAPFQAAVTAGVRIELYP